MFDLLQTSGRPLSAGEVAQAVGASLDGTERLLSACTGLELLAAHTQDGQGHSHLLLPFLSLTQSHSFTHLMPSSLSFSDVQ